MRRPSSRSTPSSVRASPDLRLVGPARAPSRAAAARTADAARRRRRRSSRPGRARGFPWRRRRAVMPPPTIRYRVVCMARLAFVCPLSYQVGATEAGCARPGGSYPVVAFEQPPRRSSSRGGASSARWPYGCAWPRPTGRARPRLRPPREGSPSCSPRGAWTSASRASTPWTASTSRSSRGEILGLIGPNGAGKTTLVNVAHRLPATGRRARVAPRRRGGHAADARAARAPRPGPDVPGASGCSRR